MAAARSSWIATAGYLYVLQLDTVSLAWEYLRRDPGYQAHWLDMNARSDSSAAAGWGLEDWEDPRRDGRAANPIWLSSLPTSVILTRYVGPKHASPFQFWGISGQKSLFHDGSGMRLTVRKNAGVTRVVLGLDLAADQPYGYIIPAGSNVDRRCRAVNEFAQFNEIAGSANPQSIDRPSRLTVMHMRILQALDGARLGASHRQIARALFGNAAVQKQWNHDGELRAQIRHYLRRGAAFTGGEYRTLLDSDSS